MRNQARIGHASEPRDISIQTSIIDVTVSMKSDINKIPKSATTKSQTPKLRFQAP